MSPVGIRTATPLDEASVIDVITLAFAADPPFRWLYPEPQQYLKNIPRFIRGYGGLAFQHGSTHLIEGYFGAALWLPPDVHPDEAALDALLERSTTESQRKAVLQILQQLAAYHPSVPHWHLAVLGIDPLQQNCGYGSLLMERALRAFDRNGEVAYLESTNAKNLPFYKRHGFDLLGTIQVDTVPPIFPMSRRPLLHEPPP